MNRVELKSMVDKVLGKAKRLYGFDRSVQVNFRNMGRCAGMAYRDFRLAFNTQLLNQPEDEIFNTVTHEIAHLVCYDRPELGKGHNEGWRRVDLSLGGDGSRLHELPLKKSRRTRKAVYMVDNREVKVGMAVHNKIMRGQKRFMRDTKTSFGKAAFTGKIIMT